MRLAFSFFNILFGLAHVAGFFLLPDTLEAQGATIHIADTIRLIALFAFVFFVLTGFFYIKKSMYWWISGLAAVIFSQILIIQIWEIVKLLTILNALIFLVCLFGIASYRFKRKVNSEIKKILSKVPKVKPDIITNKSISNLPASVQHWLKNSGIIDQPDIQSVYIRQRLRIKMKPGQKNWINARADQYFTTHKPAFLWSVRMKLMPFLDVVGRDKFEDGKGEMLIKVMSMFPVVHSKGNKKIDTGTLQRYLGEIIWFPSVVLKPYISWEVVDEYTAKATMNYKGTKGSGTFYFDEQGNLEKYSALRYMEADAKEKTEWNVEVQESKTLNGLRIPVKMTATWRLEKEDWTWLELELKDIQYNFV